MIVVFGVIVVAVLIWWVRVRNRVMDFMDGFVDICKIRV